MRSAAIRGLVLRRTAHHRPLQIPATALPPRFVRHFAVDSAAGSSSRDQQGSGPSIQEPLDPSTSESISAAPAMESIPSQSLPIDIDTHIGSSQRPYAPPSPPPAAAEASSSSSSSQESSSSNDKSSTDLPSTTMELINVAQPHDFGPYAHPFDSLVFFRRLKEAGLKPNEAEGLTDAFREVARWQYSRSRMKLLSKTMMEHELAMWKRHTDDLRRDVKMNTETEATVLTNSTNNTRREVTGLERRIQEDIEQMRHEIEMDINNRKSENRIDSKRFEIEIEETYNKFTISCSDVKTQIEKARWDSSRRATAVFLWLFGIAAYLLGCFDFMDKGEPPAAAPPAPVQAQTAPVMRDVAVGTDETLDEVLDDMDYLEDDEEVERRLESLLQTSGINILEIPVKKSKSVNGKAGRREAGALPSNADPRADRPLQQAEERI